MAHTKKLWYHNNNNKVRLSTWFRVGGAISFGIFATQCYRLFLTTIEPSVEHNIEIPVLDSLRTTIHPPKERLSNIPVFEYNFSYGHISFPLSLGNLSILSQASRSFRKNAIVLLIQKKHSSYRRDSYGLLVETLQLLRDNYLLQDYPNHLENTDIFLFHTGDYDVADLMLLEALLLESTNYPVGAVKLVNLDNSPYWRLPHNLQEDNVTQWFVANQFSIGYRHMCRFFAITIWDLFHRLGDYEYIFRLDEDSLILSPIEYDIFEFMKRHDYAYGFRLCSYELTHHKFVSRWWNRWHTEIQHKAQRWPIDWNLCGFYNNFFVASVPFFKTRPVQTLLKQEIDRRKFIYRVRYGDLLVHTLAVYAYAPPERIHRFLDFTYQHMTEEMGSNCTLQWGAIQAGYHDPNANETLTRYYVDHNVDRCLAKCQEATASKICSVHVHDMTRMDLSPTYSHLSSQTNISLYTIAAGKVEMQNMGNLSG